MSVVALFDLDNTVIRGSSMFRVALRLVRMKVISRKDILWLAWSEFRYVRSRTEDPAVTGTILDFALQIVQGRSVADVQRVCASVARKIVRERLISEMVEQIRWHQVRGHQTWLVTASSLEIASAISTQLGMTGALATTAETSDGQYTGRMPQGILHGPAKATAVRAEAVAAGWDLENSYAYSDSMNDLPLLCLVGHAAVINANKELLKIARKNHWKIFTSKRNRHHFVASRSIPQHERQTMTRLSVRPGRDLLVDAA